ncbi:hypothetical protein [Methanobacterium sp. CWC-01]|uniref:hypothetical protein n=1 Tax=Methanobacterium aridiramus TaxID=2584467 RepID=UPI002575E68C|nr:hypothetical protein [Methanobacterium sp. CWC-01]
MDESERNEEFQENEEEFTREVTENKEPADEFNEEFTEEFQDEQELEEEIEEEIEGDEEDEGLPFAKAEVVRLMKQNLDSDKMIRERVKVEMNRFLGDVLKKVCDQLNQYPYTTIEYEMLKESIYPYENIERINEEKKRILKHLDAIKADCDALSMDVKVTLRLNASDDTDEDDIFK